ncbi:MAG: DUF2807 domain-containing protein [Cytophagaceae bacterium]|nr:DUF2807 domain-containing protein [Cytophagaceae bacterium]|tara:strand:+ start:10787 stop:11545 length:759 start_codon:yes stop_codon:yes gene_type:complete
MNKGLKIALTISLFLFLGCSMKFEDCFQGTGDIIEQQYDLDVFTKVRAERGVSMVIKQGDEQKVVLRAGENLIDDITVQIVDGVLSVRDNNTCNLGRDYGTTTVLVTVPELTEIRNASGFEVSSDGVLNFENLVLVADTSVNILEPKKDGTFTLDLDVTNLTVRSNGLAEFNLRGSADNLNLRFFNEAPRLNGRNLIVQTANVDHRGANDAIFDVRQSIEGIIRGVGNVICPIEPPSVDVETLSKGRLIFEN